MEPDIWGESRDDAYSVSQTSDGGYIVIGYIRSYGPYGDAWLIKTDANGNEQWSKTFGGKYEDESYSGYQTRDGGYILAGKTGSYGAGYFDAWLIKTDTNGKEQWNRAFGGLRDDYVRSVQQTSDGGYILAGKIGSYIPGAIGVRLIKTDADGNQQWNKVFGRCEAYSVQQVSDVGYVIAGLIYHPDSPPVSSDVWLVKVAGAEADATLPEVSASDANETVSGGMAFKIPRKNPYQGLNFGWWQFQLL